MEDDIIAALDDGLILLTPNLRLAAEWHRRHASYKASQKILCYPTPHILPFNTWLHVLFEQAALHDTLPAPRLLNNTLSHYLWESIVQSTTDEVPLLQPSRTAQLLQKAYTTLKEWRIPLDDSMLIQTAEDERANDWMRRYEVIIHKNNWLDVSALPEWLISKWSLIKPVLPKQFMKVEFNELTPLQQHFFSCLKQEASERTSLQDKNINPEVKRITLATEKEEWITAARFAKAHQAENPNSRIAIVVPDLEHKRDRILHQFKTYFDDNEINISAGKPLPDYPIIHAAIQLLNLYHGHLQSDELTYLLNTPYLAGAEREQVGRAHIDLIRREENVTTINLKKLSKRQASWLQEHAPIFFDKLQCFYKEVAPLKKQKLTAWASQFNTLLTTLGWPGERILNSEEYQIVQAWLRLLVTMQQLDLIADELAFNEALHCLTLMAHQTVFQAKTPETNVQLLGLLEAAGLPFDVLWVMGLDHQNWPPAPKPNPFIPKRLQREKGMPHSTADRELIYCQHLMRQFMQAAPRIYFSYAKVKDDSEREASGLIKAIKLIDKTELSLFPRKQHDIAESLLENLRDEIAPPVTALKLTGGVNLIKLQAQCPFKAFAECRLDAKPLNEPEPGLSAKDRGNLLHSALESLWQKIKTQEALLDLSPADLATAISDAVTLALNSCELPFDLSSHYIKLESQRLNTLVNDWLNIEKTRPPFKVLTHEKSVSLPLSGLTISARIDRIDELENGDKMIIDYKTGKNNKVAAWFDDKPDQPQLPLYTLVNPDEIKTITYAQVATGHCEFVGVSEDDTGIKGIYPLDKLRNDHKEPSWGEQLQQWKATFTKLATDYAKGDARVAPKHKETSCAHCSLTPFCRIHEEGITS